MNLQQLKYILSVADLKHFGLAANQCFVTQSTLSTMIAKLESEFLSIVSKQGAKLQNKSLVGCLLTMAKKESELEFESTERVAKSNALVLSAKQSELQELQQQFGPV